MSAFSNPFDPKVRLGTSCGCGEHACGEHSGQAHHDAEHAAGVDDLRDDAIETLNARALENAVVRALFPHDQTRPRFLRAVGASTEREHP